MVLLISLAAAVVVVRRTIRGVVVALVLELVGQEVLTDALAIMAVAAEV